MALGTWGALYKDLSPIQHILVQIAQSQHPHAILLTARDVLLDRDILELLAQQYICSEKTACGTCGPCQQLYQGTYLDLIVVPETELTITIETIRRIEHMISETTLSGRRALLLPDLSRLTHDAAHAFLKTLEEPVSDLLILATTTHVDELLPTIRSRLLEVSLPALSRDQICAFLVAQSFATLEEAEESYLLARGDIAVIRDIALNPMQRKEFKEELAWMDTVFSSTTSRNERYRLFTAFLEKRELSVIIKRLLHYLQDRDDISWEKRGSLIEALEKAYILREKHVQRKLITDYLFESIEPFICHLVPS